MKINVIFLIIFFGFIIAILLGHRVIRWRLDLWLPAYIIDLRRQKINRIKSNKREPRHILFCVSDHFEPNHGAVEEKIAENRIREWLERYPLLASRFTDSNGVPPRHTWFFGSHHDHRFLADLSDLCYRGLGEVEYHLHHENDHEESLRRRILKETLEYAYYGCLWTAEDIPQRRYAFVHGDWAISNSSGGKYCGVNAEFRILEETGCFADFTMPSCGPSQSKIINSIYYPDKSGILPRGHDRGVKLETEVVRKESNGLVCIQGPLGVLWHGVRGRIENASLTTEYPATPDRIAHWMHTGISVMGRPEWIFVKLHAHGGIERDWEALFGSEARKMHECLAMRWNDGKHYRLHYVTAREMYNITKAAEAGMNGDPGLYRDYHVPSYANTKIMSNARYLLDRFNASNIEFRIQELGKKKLTIKFNNNIMNIMTENMKDINLTKIDKGGMRISSTNFNGEQFIYFYEKTNNITIM